MSWKRQQNTTQPWDSIYVVFACSHTQYLPCRSNTTGQRGKRVRGLHHAR